MIDLNVVHLPRRSRGERLALRAAGVLVPYPAPAGAQPDPSLLFARCPACGHDNDHVPQHLAIGSQAACVDRPLVELITLLWTADLWTQESCQGSLEPDGRVRSLLVMAAADADAFVNVLLAHDVDEQTYDRVACGDDLHDGWTIGPSIAIGAEFDPPRTIDASLSVTFQFPFADLPWICDRLRADL